METPHQPVGLDWKKSSRSANMGDNCVEVAVTVDTGVYVRDTKDRGADSLHVSATAWSAFLDAQSAV
jgi:hypothetical protein